MSHPSSLRTSLRDRKDEIAVLRQVTDEVMEAIRRLSGQEYVDVYAADVKSGRVPAPPCAARD